MSPGENPRVVMTEKADIEIKKTNEKISKESSKNASVLRRDRF